MWMKNNEGLVANLFGESELTTEFKGQDLKIRQETNYPFGFNFLFTVETDADSAFVISIRKPLWAKKIDIRTEAEVELTNNYYRFKKNWKTGDQISIEYHLKPALRSDSYGKYYVSYGPLIFALELEGEPLEIKDYDLKGFRDLHYEPASSELLYYPQLLRADTEISTNGYDAGDPWRSLSLRAWIYDPENIKMKEVFLVPMGGTVLRKITFEPGG
jgi:DUF1680 family protein